MIRPSAVAPAVALGLALALAAPAHAAPAPEAVAEAALSEAPVWDGHNDVREQLRAPKRLQWSCHHQRHH